MGKKAWINYIINVGLLISFICVFITGIIKYPGLLFFLLGIGYIETPLFTINDLHDNSGIIMGILVLAHLVLNWKFMWIYTKNIFKRSKGNQESIADGNAEAEQPEPKPESMPELKSE